MARIADIKQQMDGRLGEEVLTLVGQSDVDKRSYSSKNLPLWVSKVSAWAQSETRGVTSFPTRWRSFAQPVLDERTKTRGAAPQHPLFVAIETLLAEPLTLNDLVIARAPGGDA